MNGSAPCAAAAACSRRPGSLFYGTGGLAYGSIKTTGALAGFNGNGVAVASIGSSSDIRVGWTVGAGVEGMITNNWTAKLEYLYMDLGSFPRRQLHARAARHDWRAMWTRASTTTSCVSA